MSDVYLVGVGMTPFGKFFEKSVKDLTREATEDALSDAGVKVDDAVKQQVQTLLAAGKEFEALEVINNQLNESIGTIGPKGSSFIIVKLSFTSSKTVGS